MAVMVGLFYWYFSYSQKEIKNLNNTITMQEIAIKSKDNEIKTLKDDTKRIQEINKEISETKDKSSEQYRKLSDTLTKLDRVHTSKAGLLEKIINQASKDRTRCFELAMGVKPLKDEKNRVCPQLLN